MLTLLDLPFFDSILLLLDTNWYEGIGYSHSIVPGGLEVMS